MKFLLNSRYGDGAAIAYRLKEEGNTVALWIKERALQHAWEGILPKVEKWNNFLDRKTVVVFDSTGGGKTADRLRQQGYPVFGSSVFADELELDRQFGIDLMEQCGIKIPKTVRFTNLDEGQEFARRHKENAWVFKPSGMIPSYLTYVPSDAEDMIQYFDYLKKVMKGEKVEFELQQYVEGIAVSTEAWCDGSRFVPPYNHTLEKKRFLNSDLGPGTGCVGNVVWAEPNPCRVIKEGLGLAETAITAGNYIGCIDLNTIVTPEAVYALEWTPRFGYDAISAFLRLYKGEIGKVFSDFAQGAWEGDMELPTDKYAGSVRLTIPPAPDEQHPCGPGTPLRGFTTADRKDCYFYEVMTDPKTGAFVHSGGFGTILSATGVALSPRESLEKPYSICERAKIPNKQYRTDLREVFEGMHQEFMSLGG